MKEGRERKGGANVRGGKPRTRAYPRRRYLIANISHSCGTKFGREGPPVLGSHQ